ncbi:MAG: hypothetical protein AAF202_10900, partial [Pseudomonadota bacterium]
MSRILLFVLLSFSFQSLASFMDDSRVSTGNCGSLGCGEVTSDEELVESIAVHDKFLDQVAELDVEISGKI